MSLRRLPLLLLVAALQAFGAAAAEAAGDGPVEGILDCEHPPKDLVDALPREIAAAATVLCTPSAQMIVAREGWAWRFPGSFFDRPSIPAFAPKDSRAEAGGRYFTGFRATDLSQVEISKLHATLSKTLATYTDAVPPARIVRLVAHNDKGYPMDAYFGFRSAKEGWVALCAPDCAPELFFLINRQD
jgi:hypothetical protein